MCVSDEVMSSSKHEKKIRLKIDFFNIGKSPNYLPPTYCGNTNYPRQLKNQTFFTLNFLYQMNYSHVRLRSGFGHTWRIRSSPIIIRK